MKFFESVTSVLVVVPHPDDETLAVGGTLARLASMGVKTHLLIVSGHLPPLYPPGAFEETVDELDAAYRVLGLSGEVKFLRIPATTVSDVGEAKVANLIREFIDITSPEIVFSPFPDRHIDHRLVFDATMVATRPKGVFYPSVVLCYETLSETHWNAPAIEPIFAPNIFVDITGVIEFKKMAVESYISQTTNTPSRDWGACEGLARFRGSQSGYQYSEGFQLVRMLL